MTQLTLTRFKKSAKRNAVLGILKDNKGGTYFALENYSTLIPAGTYDVKSTWSPKFQAMLPLITNDSSPESRGLRLHAGNSAKDSQGCVLVGDACDLESCTISKSHQGLNQLIKSLDKDNVLVIKDGLA